MAQAPDWDAFATSIRDPVNDFHPDVAGIPHPAAQLLEELRTAGATAATSNPWTLTQRLDALARGAHKSAKDNVPFLREEFTDMMLKGQWTLLPARLLIGDDDLRLSPLGVVPQRDRRPRTICDYTFFNVNADTIQLAPPEAMQFGRALPRLLQRILHASPGLGPVYLSKIDVADGFYRIGIRPNNMLKLAVIFPTRPGEEPLIALPLTLPMGWLESPPYFNAATETIADLANATLGQRHPPHRLDATAETPGDAPPAVEPAQLTPYRGQTPLPVPTHHTTPHYHRPLAYWDVYVDDFIGLSQGNQWRRRNVKRALLQALDSVFRPLAPDDNPHRQEPGSVKKMTKGEATWATRKTVLGWTIDTTKGTLELPPHRAARLDQLLASVAPAQRRVAKRTWHQLLHGPSHPWCPWPLQSPPRRLPPPRRCQPQPTPVDRHRPPIPG